MFFLLIQINFNHNCDLYTILDPIAFEVPAEDEKDETESLIKRHPPRRLRMAIEETDTTPSLTQEILSEKVQMANERRNQVRLILKRTCLINMINLIFNSV